MATIIEKCVNCRHSLRKDCSRQAIIRSPLWSWRPHRWCLDGREKEIGMGHRALSLWRTSPSCLTIFGVLVCATCLSMVHSWRTNRIRMTLTAISFATGTFASAVNSNASFKQSTRSGRRDPASRYPPSTGGKRQLPMWHKYRVELFPHIGQFTGIVDQFGYELEFPSAFRQSRSFLPKGIVKLIGGTP